MAVSGPSLHSFTFDAETQLHDGAAVTTTSVGQVSAADKVLDFGETTVQGVENIAYTPGTLVVDVSAFDFGTGDEVVDVLYQLSNTSDFSGTVVTKAALHWGAALGPDGTDQEGVGRNLILVDNQHLRTIYRYARAAFVVGGTTPSITPLVFLSRNVGLP